MSDSTQPESVEDLSVNLESQQISKEVLSKLFDGQTFKGTTHEVYFRPEIDTIVFENFINFNFPQSQAFRGTPSELAYQFPPQTECDSVKILELDECLGMWRYNAAHFRSLDLLILRTGPFGERHELRVLDEAKKYYEKKLAHENCTKIPSIVIRLETLFEN
ncbi:hypothetical protein SBOR_5913 [Sclerotinia borealis F-4128]|uniref:Uncharacterized protein n=1 Tax=Sclerotinia borealis (strain F-4128) TaxID=1432307 RepID=W9CD26_SCLBF|nr:hypothetical protein SBOR_5913 [Sclerotinia borealis F-4128]